MPRNLYKSFAYGAVASLFFLASAVSHAGSSVTGNTIVLGQSAALSGPAKQLGIEMRDGALAYFDYINANGGVNGKQIVLKSLDDGYEAERAAANTRELIEKENVFALFGYVGTPTSNAALPLVNKESIPFFAPFTGSPSMRTPFNRNIFNIRAGYFAETERIVENMTAVSVKKFAVFYQNDAYGKAGLEGVTRALKKRHLEVEAIATVERNSVDVAAAVAKMKQVQPQAIIMVSAYSSCAAFIRAMQKDAQFVPYFWNISFVGSQALSKELGEDGRGVMISQVVPAPWDEKRAVVKQYHQLYVNRGGHEAGFVSLEGFIAAKAMVEAMKRAGGKLTRETFTEAAESMHDYDMGGFSVKFGPNDHDASDFIDLTVITQNGKFLN
jgi:ABC-type branched-subunit amino acid transport system substrate-binding protein